MRDYVYQTNEKVVSQGICANLCLFSEFCKSFNYNPVIKVCELIASDLNLLPNKTGIQTLLTTLPHVVTTIFASTDNNNNNNNNFVLKRKVIRNTDVIFTI